MEKEFDTEIAENAMRDGIAKLKAGIRRPRKLRNDWFGKLFGLREPEGPQIDDTHIFHPLMNKFYSTIGGKKTIMLNSDEIEALDL